MDELRRSAHDTVDALIDAIAATQEPVADRLLSVNEAATHLAIGRTLLYRELRADVAPKGQSPPVRLRRPAGLRHGRPWANWSTGRLLPSGAARAALPGG